MNFQHPKDKLLKISKNRKQIWPVIYIKKEKTEFYLKHDLEIVSTSGCDACVLEMNSTPDLLEKAISFGVQQFPHLKIGVNYLGGSDDPYGYINSFQIAKRYELPIIWTDFSGVDLIEEHPEVSLHSIEQARYQQGFYCSGIHMKYGTLKDQRKSIEQSALQAMGWVDGIIITGKKTGHPTNPEHVRQARTVIGHYPLGIASGLTLENAPLLLPYIDFALVNSSIADNEHHLIMDKVVALTKLFHQYQ